MIILSDTKKAYSAAILQVMIIGFSFMFVKISLPKATPIDILAYRFFFAFAVSSIPVLLKKVKVSITFKDLMKILPLALFYPVSFFLFQTFGLLYASSSEAGIIQATVPIFTVILATIILKERTTLIQKMAIALSVSGILFLAVSNSQNSVNFNALGTLLLLVSALSNAMYSIFARRLTQKYSFYLLSYMMTLLGFLIFTSLSVGTHLIDGTLSTYLTPLTDLPFLLSILYLGVLSSFVSTLLSNYALSKIEATKISIFANLAPIISIFAGIILLNEAFKWYHLVGVSLTLIGVAGTLFFGKTKKQT